MIVRQSPSAKVSPSKGPAWPPQSPHEVLLYSPRRDKLLKRSREVSPSPCKHRRVNFDSIDDSFNADNEEDEETLQLQLAEIQAKLKLKKIQNAKKQLGLPKSSRIDSPVRARIEVPASPKAARVSGKRQESPGKLASAIDTRPHAAKIVPRKPIQVVKKPPNDINSGLDHVQAKHKSFNAALLETRTQEQHRAERREQLENDRSTGFGLAQKPTDPRSNRHILSSSKDASPSQRSHLISSKQTLTGTGSNNILKFRPPGEAHPANPSAEVEPCSGFSLVTRTMPQAMLESAFENKTVMKIPDLLKVVVAPHYEPPETELADFVVLGIIASKSSPHKHADTLKTKSGAVSSETGEDAGPERSKFMVMKLTDLKWEVDLFLFDTAFSAFWKLPIGTVIALLNPGIMPPRPHLRDSGKFSLKLASSEDVILEIGVSKDLGWCRSIKKDGKECGQWVDVSGGKSEVCDFHISLGIERAKASRPEINGMIGFGLFGNGVKDSRGSRSGGRGRGRGKGRGKGEVFQRQGPQHDWSSGETAYVIPKQYAISGNTAKLLDADDYVHGASSKSDRDKKRLAEKQKERKLAKALGSAGSGLGGEYMRVKRLDPNATQAQKDAAAADKEAAKPASVAELGLVGGHGRFAPTSVTKRKADREPHAEPMGWGGASRRDLLPYKTVQPDKSEEKPDVESPRKKARFLIEKKGIRIPGRDSLAASTSVDYDDDDLEIVRS